jgi:polyisoprenoid-binding protein YceI
VLRKYVWSVSIAASLFAPAAAPMGPGPVALAVDGANSQVVITVGKTGVFGFAGHAHEVVAPTVRGRVTVDLADWQRASVSLEFDASALRVTGKGEAPADVPVVQQVMLSEQVLDVTRFPTIAFQSRRVSVTARTATTADVMIEGDTTLHGVTRPMTIRAGVTLDAGSHFTARGTFSLKQTDFGMVPVSAAAGTIRVKDELSIQFVIRGSPADETRIAR